MTLQNRVTPFGQLKAINSRGKFLGNRGILHNDEKHIIKQWRHKAWVTCRLDYPGIRREIFSKGNYSELFFLDEVTALSAGHRPCGECRRDDYKRFKELWQMANLESCESGSISIAQIDKQVHTERAGRDGTKVTYQSSLNEVPNGVFISINGVAVLKWNNKLLEWSADGYSKYEGVLPEDFVVDVLTPKSVVGAVKAGYVPQVHHSAD
ncbi:hypothetical protein H8K52_00420 [Undibacterium seohonense]|uniref:Uncharacterized protein n=1 Tax=Undibacterium seohonense TaxID=1344950 RepID=A0ABR6WYR6_9BURK|nr:hypothetical protein [Undibacterium seohonense]MBC3805805.1 hypothetical protein [Undibacterium seohonense]